MFTAADARELKSYRNEILHSQTVRIAQQERETTESLLWHLKEIEQRRLYLDFNVGSLFAYCIKELKMSEGSAGRRVNAARMLRDFPELSEKLAEGTLNLSNLSTLQSFVRAEEARMEKKMPKEEKRELLAKIENRSKQESEQLLAQALPEARPARNETRVLGNGDLEKTIRLSPELRAKLERIRELNSHKRDCLTFEGLLEMLADEHLERNDPELKENAVPKANSTAAKRRVSPTVSTTTYLYKRAQSQCEHVNADGSRCPRRYHLQIDHIVPLARGGGNELENLQLLCRPHNLRKGVREPVRQYVA